MRDKYRKMAQEVIDKVFNEQDIRKACQPQNTFKEYLAVALEQSAQSAREEAIEECAVIAENDESEHEDNGESYKCNGGMFIADAIRRLKSTDRSV